MSSNVWKKGWALVTGASSGIGRELCLLLAARGASVILVARSEGELGKLREEIESRGGVARVFAAHLAEPGAAEALILEITAAGLVVEHLVNCAGVGLVGAFAEQEPRAVVRMIRLNCMALTSLTRGLLPGMLERRSGGVIQVASMVAFAPTPFMAAYAGTKAYVRAFSDALWEELRGSGVTLTTVCPGYVASGFQATAGYGQSARALPGALSARETAERGLRAYEKKKRLVVTGWLNRIVAWISELSPRSVSLPLTGWVLRRSARV